jgi:hypothetical protein
MWKKIFILLVLALLLFVCNWFAINAFGTSISLARVAFLTLTFLLAATLVLAAQRLSTKGWIVVGLANLVGLFLTSSFYPVGQPSWMSMLVAYAITLLPSVLPELGLVVAGILLYSVLSHSRQAQNADRAGRDVSAAQRPGAGRLPVVALVLGVLLIAVSLYNLYWLTVWDNTTDSIGYFWINLPVIGAVFAGILLSVFLPGKTKLFGVLYTLLIPFLLYAVSTYAQQVDYHQLTEGRAAQVNQAIETYFVREGRYPHSLQQLAPWYLLTIPGPVITIGQDWCYQGGDNYYQFGYVNMANWMSTKITGQLVAARGDVSGLGPICGPEIKAIISTNPEHYVSQ